MFFSFLEIGGIVSNLEITMDNKDDGDDEAAFSVLSVAAAQWKWRIEDREKKEEKSLLAFLMAYICITYERKTATAAEQGLGSGLKEWESTYTRTWLTRYLIICNWHEKSTRESEANRVGEETSKLFAA